MRDGNDKNAEIIKKIFHPNFSATKPEVGDNTTLPKAEIEDNREKFVATNFLLHN